MDGIISAHEAKTHFGELLKRVERGEEVVITRRELPIARMVPENRLGFTDMAVLIKGLKERRKERRLNADGLPHISLKEIVEAGRR